MRISLPARICSSDGRVDDLAAGRRPRNWFEKTENCLDEVPQLVVGRLALRGTSACRRCRVMMRWCSSSRSTSARKSRNSSTCCGSARRAAGAPRSWRRRSGRGGGQGCAMYVSLCLENRGNSGVLAGREIRTGRRRIAWAASRIIRHPPREGWCCPGKALALTSVIILILPSRCRVRVFFRSPRGHGRGRMIHQHAL